jgi:hypothetical protein
MDKQSKVVALAEKAEKLGYVLQPADEYYAQDLARQNKTMGAWHRQQRATGKPVNPPALPADQTLPRQRPGRSRP